MPAKRPEVLIALDEAAEQPLYQQIYEAVRRQILEGVVRKGEKLPSIRSLIKDLGVSHATVERAYLQLSLEGYVQAIPRSGYVVAPIDLEYFSEKWVQEDPENVRTPMRYQGTFYEECRRGDAARYDFAYTSLQPGSFPRRAWRKIYGEVLDKISNEDLVSYYHKDEPCLL